MRRFLLLTLAVCLLVALFTAASLLVPMDKGSFFYAYHRKVLRADTLSKPRLIVVGGSSVAFNTDSRLLERETGRHVVNLGLHAGVGAAFAVAHLERLVKKGDVVVLQIEYEQFFDDTNLGKPELLASAFCYGGFPHVRWVNVSHGATLLSGLPAVAWYNDKRLVRHVLFGKPYDTPCDTSHFSYSAAGFDDYGDEVSHLRFPNDYVYHTVLETRPFSTRFARWLIQELARLSNDVVIVNLPPATIASAVRDKASTIRLVERCFAGTPFRYVLPPQAMAVPDSMAFNTIYHLDSAGRRLNTAQIIRAVRKKVPAEGTSKPAGRNLSGQ